MRICASAFFVHARVQHLAFPGRAERTFGSIQRDPVSELRTVGNCEKAFLPRLPAGILHRLLHALILLFKDPKITVRLPDEPRNNCRRIVPDRHAGMCPQDIRHRERHAELLCLLDSEIPEPFAVKECQISMEKRCREENFRVSRIAEALISLRTIHWNIQVVRPHSPVDISCQLIHSGVIAGKLSPAGKICMDHARGKVLFIYFLKALHRDIAEAMECELRKKNFHRSSTRNKSICCSRRPQIRRKQVAILIQSLRVPQHYFRAGFAVKPCFDHAGEILSEINNRFAGR